MLRRDHVQAMGDKPVPVEFERFAAAVPDAG